MTLRGVQAMHHLIVSIFKAEDVAAIEIVVAYPKRGRDRDEKHFLFGLPCGCTAALTEDEAIRLADLLNNGAASAPHPAYGEAARTLATTLREIVTTTVGISRHGLH
jgi:hypothetical protein